MDIDTLLEGFKAIGSDPDAAWAFWAYVLACIVGQVANAVWLWLGKEIDCVADRFRDDPRSSIKSALTNVGIVVGTAVLMPWAGVPIKAAIMMGILQGAYSDSKLNKSTRAVWTPAQRQAAADAEVGK